MLTFPFLTPFCLLVCVWLAQCSGRRFPSIKILAAGTCRRWLLWVIVSI
jgi:hypothetical protein